MAEQQPTSAQQAPGAPVRWVLRTAAALAVLCAGLSLWLALAPLPQASPDVPEPAQRPPAPREEPPAPRAPRPARSVGARAQPAEPAAPTPPPAHEAPPGSRADRPLRTDNLLRGLVVPELFALPEGYVRHYQATEDGQRMEAILLFHPDSPPVDAQGEPLPMPEDRVVPPELAPPGLPLRLLEMPEEAEREPDSYGAQEEEQPAQP
jgi:hypothetical protein